jgi:hypothetical protein
MGVSLARSARRLAVAAEQRALRRGAAIAGRRRGGTIVRLARGLGRGALLARRLLALAARCGVAPAVAGGLGTTVAIGCAIA